MATKKQKIHGIIHTAALACASVGAGLAQVPASDSAVIAPLQTAMIIAIAHQHGVVIAKSAAVDLLFTFTATQIGRGVSQLLIGWIPALGNAINAVTAATLTEAVGWAADEYFRAEQAPGCLGAA
ncbi:hypothetical protein WI91_08020 [Burkholderia vietnamiensis]|uniref:hypothetical protein n=1 Tax=Burkholderia vietnamiensis TaxID=60552 RepID=UPI000755F9FB|nr:hypothetical protein [Burkholderia vietnamiensis]KVE06284.1 hypothetical protein WI91_08020 [Burkholderia vietnamiensis]